MTKRHVVFLKLLLHVRPVHSGFHSGGEGPFVHLQHAIHPAHVETDHKPARLVVRLQATGDVRAASKGDDYCIVFVGRVDYDHHILLARGIDNEIGRVIDLAAAQAQEITKGLAGRMDEAVFFPSGNLIVRQRVL